MSDFKKDWNKFKKTKIVFWPFKGRSVNDLKLRKRKNSLINYTKENHRWIIAIFVSSLLSILSLVASRQPVIPETNRFTYLVPTEVSTPKSVAKINCKSSLSATRNDAARCSLDGSFSMASIIDPCFLTISTNNLIFCPMNPYDESTIFELGQTEKDVVYNEVSSSPWFVVLDDGTECTSNYGGTRAVADSSFDYDCNGNNFVNLVSPIDKEKSLWRIRCLRPNDKRLEFCSIKDAWF